MKTLTLNSKNYIRQTKKNLELVSKESDLHGTYKLSVRKGGSHITVTLFNEHGNAFAAIACDNGSAFFVTATTTDEGVRYMHSTCTHTEKELNILDMDSKAKRTLAESVIDKALEIKG
ncbi:hypothetical protein VCHA53O466_140073 [Vibrio chagasii]|nr:hypothetical protein VCHA53O466_140073 [Vibrio chagasii]